MIIKNINWERILRVSVALYGAHWLLILAGLLLLAVVSIVWPSADVDLVGFFVGALWYLAYTIGACIVLVALAALGYGIVWLVDFATGSSDEY